MSEKQQLTSPNLLLACELKELKRKTRRPKETLLDLSTSYVWRPSSRDDLVAAVLLEPARYDPRLLGPHPRQPLGVVLAGEPQIHVVRA